ncbi:flagellin [Halobacteriales archaeon SW_10_68_16]|jgi:flagellar protein FlaF|nr:MAG: flagellin [Halobacteriales archaeon SW_10_68_16]
MGFSVSGAAAIIFASLFIAFGMWYSAGMNSFERVTEAQNDRTDTVLETSNTDIEIVSTTYAASEDNLTVRVNNTGTAQLSVSDTDLIVDGEYRTDWAESSVAGDRETDLWLAGEQLKINVSASSQPDRVKVVADTGVADTAEVSG